MLIKSPYQNNIGNSALLESEHWFLGNRLEEALHIFNPNINSAYRNIIRNMVQTITGQSPDRYVKLYLLKTDEYAVYEFHKPFAGIPYFNIIDTLKIYYRHVDTNPDSVIICSPSSGDAQEFNNDELPLFETDNHLVKVMSIIMNVPVTNIAALTSAISHELQHALKLIRSEKQAQISNIDNKVYNDLIEYSTDLGKLSQNSMIITPYGYNRRDLVYYLAGFAYFCQPTEIEAHLESAYIEYKNSDITQDEVLIILRGMYDTDTDEAGQILIVLYNYLEYLDIIHKLTASSMRTDNFKKLYPKEYNKIIKILHQSKFLKGKSLFEILEYFKSKILEFLQKFGSLVLNPEML